MKIIDAHGHALLERRYIGSNGVRFPTTAELVAIMDRCSIAATVVLPLTAPECLPSPQSNEEVIEACGRFPNRLIPFCNVDPRVMRPGKDTAAYDFKGVLNYYKSLGCKGLGEWTAPVCWDDPRTGHLLAACEEVGFPVTFHMTQMTQGESGGYGIITAKDLCDVERALQRFPALQFIAHSHGFWGRAMRPAGECDKASAMNGCAERLLRRYDNLHADLSACAYDCITRDRDHGFRFLEEFQERVLFGTDLFLVGTETPAEVRRLPQAYDLQGSASNDAAPPILRLLEYLQTARQAGELSQAAYEKIMWKNVMRLLGISEDMVG